jgi:hypothetical protein
MVVEDLGDQMTQAKVGAPTQRKGMMLLQGIPRRAVVRGLMPVTLNDSECRSSLQIPSGRCWGSNQRPPPCRGETAWLRVDRNG